MPAMSPKYKICCCLVVLLDFVLISLAVHKLAESPLFFKNSFLSVMYPISNWGLLPLLNVLLVFFHRSI